MTKVKKPFSVTSPLSWSYVTLILVLLALLSLVSTKVFFNTIFNEVATVAVVAVLLSVAMLFLSWFVNAILLFQQVKKGNGTAAQLDRRIDDFNLPAGAKNVLDPDKLIARWQKAKKSNKA